MSSEIQAQGGSKKNVLPLIMVGVVGGVLIGGPTGAIIGAPMVARSVTGPAPAQGEAHAEPEEEGHGPSIYTMDDVVLNPAGTEGQRFLIARVALQGVGETFVEDMTARDAEVRDVVVRLLSAKTVVELADAGRREAVKKELQGALAARFPKAGIRAVLFPQFVIQ
ncbi:flagellar basal body-associated FliL family protein [Longimicrobium sp.]|uniref:flagellar basal body-associated FliL family protein n=1 Tax=Longimicrobium sp. TaxID=2029185 RepID=UPI002E3436F1|nr:flagellar basal body-associated FliL family protein [Longimicrobium sp.]HEX6037073.1 flagellar basal body-associated FliL family protein [Longimicrobium sp.]